MSLIDVFVVLAKTITCVMTPSGDVRVDIHTGWIDTHYINNLCPNGLSLDMNTASCELRGEYI